MSNEPGATPTCIEHGNRLVGLDQRVTFMSEEMRDLAGSVRELVKFQTTIVAQLRAAAFIFAIVQPITTALLVWGLQTHFGQLRP